MKFTRKDYPLAENHPSRIKGLRGKALSDVTLDGILSDAVNIEDLRITPDALYAQADIARSAGRPRLAENFERASELVAAPQDVVMRIYELLRPGRAKSRTELDDAAKLMSATYKAYRIAAFITVAADVYEARGLFSKRY